MTRRRRIVVRTIPKKKLDPERLAAIVLAYARHLHEQSEQTPERDRQREGKRDD